MIRNKLVFKLFRVKRNAGKGTPAKIFFLHEAVIFSEIAAFLFVQDAETLVTSRQVAYRFKKKHDKILNAIDKLKNDLHDNARSCDITMVFVDQTYTDIQGRTQRQILMNRDGFSLLVMGFTDLILSSFIKIIRAQNYALTSISCCTVILLVDVGHG